MQKLNCKYCFLTILKLLILSGPKICTIECMSTELGRTTILEIKLLTTFLFSLKVNVSNLVKWSN